MIFGDFERVLKRKKLEGCFLERFFVNGGHDWTRKYLRILDQNNKSISFFSVVLRLSILSKSNLMLSLPLLGKDDVGFIQFSPNTFGLMSWYS